MMIRTIQKIIRIGSSKGVTVPAKQLKQLGVEVGDEVEVTVKKVQPESSDQVTKEYQQFVAQYGETLENLADR